MVVVVDGKTNREGDISLALATIAAEFHVELDVLPKSIRDSVLATLRALSAAHYNAGVRDTTVRFGNTAAALKNERVASPTDMTPVVGPYGRRLRASKRPTVPVPPPNDDDGKRKK